MRNTISIKTSVPKAKSSSLPAISETVFVVRGGYLKCNASMLVDYYLQNTVTMK
jgi:hypothetical protein